MEYAGLLQAAGSWFVPQPVGQLEPGGTLKGGRTSS